MLVKQSPKVARSQLKRNLASKSPSLAFKAVVWDSSDAILYALSEHTPEHKLLLVRSCC